MTPCLRCKTPTPDLHCPECETVLQREADSYYRAVGGEVAGSYKDKAIDYIDPAIRVALESAANARNLIPTTQEALYELLENASDDVERGARLYQIDLADWQLTRAADIAEKRLEHLPTIRTDEQIRLELERCSADPVYWFEMYAFGVDPRPDAPLSLMPFALFPFQERFIEWLDRITFVQRTAGIVEKARDMGATETVLRWMLHKWLFRDGFSGLVLSANEDLVDSKKDPSTLFEKLRFQLRLLPEWMLPKGFDLHKDMPYMMLANPDNDSVIIGDAPTPNVGRQRRATFAIGDEFAAWAHGGYPQYTALSRTVNTFCPVSSVQGKFNKYSDIAHDGRTEKFEMDWRDHPWRDQRWFDALPFGYLGAAMTQEEIAQEVERNYEASQPGRVLKNIREEYCLITWDEMVRGFQSVGTRPMARNEFYDSGGRPVIPAAFNWGRVCDYGESARTVNDTHIWAYSLMCRPPESSPLKDSLFFLYSLPIEPIGATELEGYKFYAGLEESVGVRDGRSFLRKPSVNDMSHEATDPKDVLLKQCGDHWGLPDLDFDKGRRKLVFHFEIVDKHLQNPFRPELMGRCRIYFVAMPTMDGTPEYECLKNERDGTWFVTPSRTQKGFKRLREEWAVWHYPPEERGKPVPKMRPKSVFDDIITTVRYAVARWGINPQRLTKEQRVIEALPAELKPEVLAAAPPEQKERLHYGRTIEIQRIERGMKKTGASPYGKIKWK